MPNSQTEYRMETLDLTAYYNKPLQGPLTINTPINYTQTLKIRVHRTYKTLYRNYLCTKIYMPFQFNVFKMVNKT